MGFQTPATFERALQSITSHEYVLPAIQREFVWKPEQTCAFFDSLMRRYPIGSFLSWKIFKADLGNYDFIRAHHEQRWARCSKGDEWEVRQAIVNLDAARGDDPA